jgi:dinuclear metal center YbgI/SA1388 family protein
MTTTLRELVRFADECLQPWQFQDYCPNGLQVEGRPEVGRLATGVTACQALLDAAADWGADAVLVHHGYFWRGEDACITGMKRQRLAALLTAGISLLAYHLPLDAHPELGNNARLGQLMGIPLDDHEPLQPGSGDIIGNLATLPATVAAGELVARLEELTGRNALHIGDPQGRISRVAWCTGAAQGYIEAAVAAGADLFVTGEISEQTVHTAREEGIHFVAAGHHATERYGVQTLGEHLAQHFGLQHRFFDIDNPV